MVEWKCFYCEKHLKEYEQCDCEKAKEKSAYITTNTIKVNNNYVCKCGNDKMKMSSHIDFTKHYSYGYNCSKCGSSIGIQFEREYELF
jgi:hypothetical protein